MDILINKLKLKNISINELDITAFNNKMNKIGDEFRTRYSVHEFPKNILSILLKQIIRNTA